MRAAIYTSKGPAAEVLRIVDKPVPEPGAGEVRVRIAFSGVNPSDVKSRAGVASRAGGFPEVTPHSDGAGTIDKLGTGVDAALIETERRIATEKAAESGKPAEIVAKMVEGTVQKFLKEVTLLGQVFVKAEDGKQTIEQLLKSKGASIASFTLYIVGEGIEKRTDDFAAEVAAQVAAARAA